MCFSASIVYVLFKIRDMETTLTDRVARLKQIDVELCNLRPRREGLIHELLDRGATMSYTDIVSISKRLAWMRDKMRDLRNEQYKLVSSSK